MDVRLVDAPTPCTAAQNMALDEALLEAGAARQGACLRFYGWAPPSLTLGYFQSEGARSDHRQSAPLPWIRRPTGGGAIVHDRDLTYCLVAPVPDRFTDPVQFVTKVHEALTETLQKWGIPAALSSANSSRGGDEPFLCFRRRAMGDVLLDGHKICGSAQRRQRRTVLLHGSVLLGQSNYAPELPGVQEVTGRAIDANELANCWGPRIAAQLGGRLTRGPLDASILASSQRIQQRRYGTTIWNMRR